VGGGGQIKLDKSYLDARLLIAQIIQRRAGIDRSNPRLPAAPFTTAPSL